MSAVTGLDKVMRAFDMGDRVSIVHSDGLTGTIQALLLTNEGLQYQIRYWRDNIRTVEWVFADEICKLSK